jgi:hypothetical protein
MKFCVESKPRKPWLAPYRVTMFADDKSGFQPEEVFAVLELVE